MSIESTIKPSQASNVCIIRNEMTIPIIIEMKIRRRRRKPILMTMISIEEREISMTTPYYCLANDNK